MNINDYQLYFLTKKTYVADWNFCTQKKRAKIFRPFFSLTKRKLKK